MKFLYAIILLIASYVITSLVAGKPKQAAPKPALESDFDFPQHDEGTAQAIVFGDAWTPTWMVLWHGKFRTTNPSVVGGGEGGSEPPPEEPNIEGGSNVGGAESPGEAGGAGEGPAV